MSDTDNPLRDTPTTGTGRLLAMNTAILQDIRAALRELVAAQQYQTELLQGLADDMLRAYCNSVQPKVRP